MIVLVFKGLLINSVSRLGGENLAVAQNTYVVAWFKGKELNMVFGLLLSVSRLVSALILFVWLRDWAGTWLSPTGVWNSNTSSGQENITAVY